MKEEKRFDAICVLFLIVSGGILFVHSLVFGGQHLIAVISYGVLALGFVGAARCTCLYSGNRYTATPVVLFAEAVLFCGVGWLLNKFGLLVAWDTFKYLVTCLMFSSLIVIAAKICAVAHYPEAYRIPFIEKLEGRQKRCLRLFLLSCAAFIVVIAIFILQRGWNIGVIHQQYLLGMGLSAGLSASCFGEWVFVDV